MSKKFLPAFLLASLAAAPICVNAQSSAEAHSTPNVELYGGYSYVFRPYNPTTTTLSTSGMNGWGPPAQVPVLAPFLGIQGHSSGFYPTHPPNLTPHPSPFPPPPQPPFPPPP